MTELVLYGARRSGHVHRVAALLSILRLPWRLKEVLGDDRRAPKFLALNPFAQIPVLVDGDLVLQDSNAILVYLARRFDPQDRWLPADPEGQARVQRWFSVAAGEVAFGLARARQAKAYNRPGIDYPAAVKVGTRALGWVEGHLAGREWLAADRPTVADLAVYPYVRLAPEGEIPLEPYPAVLSWLSRVESIPGFVGFPIPDGGR